MKKYAVEIFTSLLVLSWMGSWAAIFALHVQRAQIKLLESQLHMVHQDLEYVRDSFRAYCRTNPNPLGATNVLELWGDPNVTNR